MTDTTNASIRSPLAIIAILGVVVVAVLAITLAMGSDDDDAPDSLPAERAEPDSVVPPTGAGTNPDGAADELNEGLMNETATDDFLDSSGASDLTTIEGAEPDGPEPATSAEGLEPAVGDGNTERMLPESDSQN